MGRLAVLGPVGALGLGGLLAFGPASAGTAWADTGTPPAISQHDEATTADGAPACVTPSTAQVTQLPWAQAYLDPEGVWQLTEGAGVTVAVLGSGGDDESGMLTGRLTLGPQEMPGAGGTGGDCVGQGSFAAGLIAARPQPGSGFAGIAPAANVLAVGVTDETGATDADALAAGIRAAADAGARVIDVTVTASSTDTALDDAVAYAIGRGSLIVAPFLADGQTTAAPTYPAALPGVLSVADLAPGGSLPADAQTASPLPGATGTAAAGSASGGGSTQAPTVDLAAPGDDVVGLGPGGTGLFTAGGPSYAAAFVAGTAALVLSYRPQLTEAQLLYRLEQTAYRPGTKLPDPNYGYGYGTVDPVNAVSQELPQEEDPSAAPQAPQQPRETLVMPPPVTSEAPREALAVAGASAFLILMVSLGAAVHRSARSRRVAGSADPRGGEPGSVRRT